MIDAESAYLFRHAVVRDAAYQLQLPSERRALHQLLLVVFGEVYGFEYEGDISPEMSSKLGPYWAELADHALLAQSPRDDGRWARVEYNCLRRAARFESSRYQIRSALKLFVRVGAHPVASIEDRIDAYFEAGESLRLLGRPGEALPHFCRMEDLARSVGLKSKVAHAMSLRGVVDLKQRLVLKEAAVERARQSGNPDIIAKTSEFLALEYGHKGEFTRCLELLREAASIAEADMVRVSVSLTLADWLLTTGEVDEAERVVRAQFAPAEASGVFLQTADCNALLAVCFAITGRIEQAVRQFRSLLSQYRERGLRSGEAKMLRHLGTALNSLGRHAEARTSLMEAEEIYTEAGLNSEVLNVRLGISMCDLVAGEFDRAVGGFRRVIQTSEAIGEPDCIAIARTHLGAALWNTGNFGDALAEIEKGLALLGDEGDLRQIAFGLGQKAVVLYKLDQIAEYRDCAHRALERMRQNKDTQQLEELTALLRKECDWPAE